MSVIDRPINFISATIAVKRAVVGAFIHGTGVITVERPYDIAVNGEGKITELIGKTLKGRGTFFTKLTKGCIL